MQNANFRSGFISIRFRSLTFSFVRSGKPLVVKPASLSHFSPSLHLHHALMSMNKSLFSFSFGASINSNLFLMPSTKMSNWTVSQLSRSTPIEPRRNSQNCPLCFKTEALDFPQWPRSSLLCLPGEELILKCFILFWGHISVAQSTEHSLINFPSVNGLRFLQFCGKSQNLPGLLHHCVKRGSCKRKSLMLLQVCWQHFRCLFQLYISQDLSLHV